MTVVRIILAVYFAAVALLTVTAIDKQGWDLVSVFVGDIMAMGWPGQFNLDFASYLTLSAIWVGWRHGFSRGGIALMPLAQVGGILFFAPYLFWAIADAKGDATVLLLGKARSAA